MMNIKYRLKCQLIPRLILVIIGPILLVPFLWPERSLQAQTISNSEPSLTLLPVADTYIASGVPDRRRPDLRVIWVGYNQAQGSLDQHALLKFNLTDLPASSTVTQAQLSLQLSSTTAGDGPLSIAVNRLQGMWDENINWAEMQVAIASSTVEIVDGASVQDVDTTFGQHLWDVTELVQKWQIDGRGSGDLLSLIMRSTDTATERERAFWSSECNEEDCDVSPGTRPLLTIGYADPTPLPTVTPAATPTATPIPSSPLQTEPAVEISLLYQKAGDQAVAQLPSEWQAGQNLSVEMTLIRKNSINPIDDLTIVSDVPDGTEFISSNQAGQFDESAKTIAWADINVPVGNTTVVSFTLRKPIPITAPAMLITETLASDVFMFDAETGTGSGLTFEWNFNDGSPTIKRPSPFQPSPAVQHLFDEPGAYTVQLYVYNQACRFVLERVITVPEDVHGTDLIPTAARHLDNRTASINPMGPTTDGTTTLPWCPTVQEPRAPQVLIRWTESETGASASRIINPREELFLPNVSAGR